MWLDVCFMNHCLQSKLDFWRLPAKISTASFLPTKIMTLPSVYMPQNQLIHTHTHTWYFALKLHLPTQNPVKCRINQSHFISSWSNTCTICVMSSLAWPVVPTLIRTGSTVTLRAKNSMRFWNVALKSRADFCVSMCVCVCVVVCRSCKQNVTRYAYK